MEWVPKKALAMIQVHREKSINWCFQNLNRNCVIYRSKHLAILFKVWWILRKRKTTEKDTKVRVFVMILGGVYARGNTHLKLITNTMKVENTKKLWKTVALGRWIYFIQMNRSYSKIIQRLISPNHHLQIKISSKTIGFGWRKKLRH